MREALARHTRTWNIDPRGAASQHLHQTTSVRRRLEAANRNNRWADAVNQIDPRLTNQPDWPALARTIQQVHETGYDAQKAIKLLARPDQPSTQPAADLRTRLIVTLHLADEHTKQTAAATNRRIQVPKPVRQTRQVEPSTPAR